MRGRIEFSLQGTKHRSAKVRPNPVGHIGREHLAHGDLFPLADGARDDLAEQRRRSGVRHGFVAGFAPALFTRAISLRAASLNVGSMPDRSTICWYIATARSGFPSFSYDFPAM